jgi:hypothetical protein
MQFWEKKQNLENENENNIKFNVHKEEENDLSGIIGLTSNSSNILDLMCFSNYDCIDTTFCCSSNSCVHP